MKNIYLIIFLVSGLFVKAQNPQFEWVKFNQGYQGDANSYYIQSDSMGNIYTIGEFSGSIDFNPSPSQTSWLSSTYFKLSFYIQKLDSNGNLVWVRQIDFAPGSKIYQFTASAAGRLYITGSFEDSVDMDPGTTTHMLYSNGGSDGFILKLSANGNFIWAKSFGGIEDDIIEDLVVDKQGNIFSHGYYGDTVDFDPGTGIYKLYAAANDAFIQKLDKNGNFIWVKTFVGSEGYTHGKAIDLDSHGNIYCAGYLGGNGIDFDPGAGTNSPPTNHAWVYIVKLDSTGSFIWSSFATNVGSYQGPFFSTLMVDKFSNVYTTGRAGGNVDYDPGPDTLLLSNVYIQKLDQNGNFLWAKSYGYRDEPMALATDTFGNVYSTGRFKDSTDLDPGPDTLIFYTYGMYIPGYGSYFQKLNSNGNLLWAGILQANLGGSGGNDILVDNLNNVFITGGYGGTVDFDPGSGINNQTSSTESTYLLKLSQCKTLTTDYQTTCDSLIWMDGVTYHQSTNSAYYTLPSAAGCDSVICLNLTVPEIDTTVSISTTGIFSSNEPSASYQWLDCNNGLSALLGDTLQNFTPTANGSYAVALDVSGCADTSACVSIQNVGIEEIEGYIINLFPNPATTQITLDLGTQNQKIEFVNIFNVEGMKVLNLNNVQSNKPIDIQSLKSGVYFIECYTTDGKRFVGKFVKE